MFTICQPYQLRILLPNPIAVLSWESHRTDTMASYQMASHYGDWSEESDDSALYEDRSMLSQTRQPMGYSKGYVPKWGPTEAFREFLQNW
jgi:hypothetical protein